MKKRITAIVFSMMPLLAAPLITGCSTQLITRVVEGLSEPVESIKRKAKKVTQINFSNEQNKETADFYFNRAIDKVEEGDYYGAISDYNKVIEINPKNANAFYNRGNIKSRDLKDHSGALPDYKKAIDLNPNLDQAYISLCLVKVHLKDYYGATSDCNKAIEINPKDPKAYINRGIAKFLIGDKKGACSDAHKGKSLGSNNGSKVVESLCK